MLVACIAALAAMLSTVLTVVSSGKSTYIETVTVQRIRWIDALRDDLTAFITRLIDQRGLIIGGKPTDRQRRAYLQAYERMVSILLKLNTKSEVDRRVLRELLHCIAAPRAADSDELDHAVARLNEAANDLLKEEWEKVKWESSSAPGKVRLYFAHARRWREYRSKWRVSPVEPLTSAEIDLLMKLHSERIEDGEHRP